MGHAARVAEDERRRATPIDRRPLAVPASVPQASPGAAQRAREEGAVVALGIVLVTVALAALVVLCVQRAMDRPWAIGGPMMGLPPVMMPVGS